MREQGRHFNPGTPMCLTNSMRSSLDDWNTYLKHKDVLFEQVRKQVSDRLPPEARVPSNRYFEASPIYPRAQTDTQASAAAG